MYRFGRYHPDELLSVPYRQFLLGQNSDTGRAATVTPALIIRSCLIDWGLVSYPNRNPVREYICYALSRPDAPDKIVSVHDTVGVLRGREARTGRNQTYPGVMIVIRSDHESRGFLFANRIAKALDERAYPVTTQVPENGTTYAIANIHRAGTILSLGEEVGKRRFLWTLDLLISFEYQEPVLG